MSGSLSNGTPHADREEPPEDANDDREDLRELVQDLTERVEALSTKKDSLDEALWEERDKRRELKTAFEEELAERDERITDLEDDVAALKDRTDLLQLLDDPDGLDGRQRSVAIIQHLHRHAKARDRRGEPSKAALNRDEAEEALRFPDVDRTTIYDDMRRAERLVGNTDVLEYKSKTGGDSELVLNLEAGEIPESVDGLHGSDGGA